MGYELYVYAPGDDEPSGEQISALLDVAGWQWALVESVESLRQSPHLNNSTALGWDLADDVGDSVVKAVAAANPELLSVPADMLPAVEIEIESPFTPDPEFISELRETAARPDLVSRVEDAVACYAFRAEGDVTETEVEFLWALASAVGVLTDGILEDVEEGSLIDCNDVED